MNYTSIQTAEDFFSSIAKAEQQTTLVNAPTSGSSVFNLSDDGLVSAVALEDVDPDLQSVLDQQYQNLLELTGIASAYIRKKANDKKDPDLIYDYDLWQQVLSNLPLMGPMKSEKSTFHQNIQSVEIATAFLNLILGFAVSSGASVLSNFQNFLQTIGQNITAGKSKGKDMNTVAAVVIQIGITQIGSQNAVVPMLKGFFMDFKKVDSKIYSSCGSVNSLDIEFDYKCLSTVFNYAALTDPNVQNSFSNFISGVHMDEIDNASTFFSGQYQQ